MPARFGIPKALRIAAGCHAFGTVVAPDRVATRGAADRDLAWLYYAGVGRYHVTVDRTNIPSFGPDDLTRVNVAFFNVNIIMQLLGALFAGCRCYSHRIPAITKPDLGIYLDARPKTI